MDLLGPLHRGRNMEKKRAIRIKTFTVKGRERYIEDKLQIVRERDVEKLKTVRERERERDVEGLGMRRVTCV